MYDFLNYITHKKILPFVKIFQRAQPASTLNRWTKCRQLTSLQSLTKYVIRQRLYDSFQLPRGISTLACPVYVKEFLNLEIGWTLKVYIKLQYHIRHILNFVKIYLYIFFFQVSFRVQMVLGLKNKVTSIPGVFQKF